MQTSPIDLNTTSTSCNNINPVPTGSAFANVSPSLWYSAPSPSYATQPTGASASQISYNPQATYGGNTETIQTTPTTRGSSAGNNLQNALQGSTQVSYVPPVAALLVQPQVIPLGSSVSVAWSTVGMSTSKPCHVVENTSTAVATVNAGSQTVTPSVTGATTFTLTCIAANTGTAITKTTTVTVQ